MAFSLPRNLLAAAMLAALALPSFAQHDAAAALANTPVTTAAPAAPAAVGQTDAVTTPAGRHHRRMQMMHGDKAKGGTPMSWQERRAAHQAKLKEQLQLSPAQATAWANFTAALEHTPSHARLGWEGMEQVTTPERIDRMRAMQAQRAADMDRRGDAVKAFYAQLDATQQKTFDAQHLSPKMNQQRMGGHYRGGANQSNGAGAGAAAGGWQHPECLIENSNAAASSSSK